MPKEKFVFALWQRLCERIFPHAEGRGLRSTTLLGEINKQLADLRVLAMDAKIAATPVLLSDFNLTPAYLPNPLEYPIFNTTVTRFGDRIVFLSRSSNLHSHNDGLPTYASLPHNTVSVIHQYDLALKRVSIDVVDDSLVRSKSKIADCGIEDARLFTWKGALWALAAGINFNNGALAVGQVLVRFNGNRIVDFVKFDSPVGAAIEKNWVPFVKDDRLFIIYCFRPMIVFEFVEGKLVLTKGELVHQLAFPIRGGTQFVKWGNYSIGLVHDASIFHDSKLYYFHRFVVLDSAFDVIEFSRPFFIQRKGLEFACGLTEYNGDLLLSYGLSERAGTYSVLPSKKLAAWLP